MAKTKLGSKHECVACGTRFYDLGKTALICPRCGVDQRNPPDDADSSGSK